MPCEIGFSCDQGIRKPCAEGRVCEVGRTTALVVDIDGENRVVNVTTERRCDASQFVYEGSCQPCPAEGVNCIDGRLSLKENFWYNAKKYGPLKEFWGKRETGQLPKATGIYQCAQGSCNLNGTSGEPLCTEGRKGQMCAICDDGYFATDALGCKRCPSGADTAVEVVGMVFFVIVLIAALLKAKTKIEAQHPILYASMCEKGATTN